MELSPSTKLPSLSESHPGIDDPPATEYTNSMSLILSSVITDVETVTDTTNTKYSGLLSSDGVGELTLSTPV